MVIGTSCLSPCWTADLDHWSRSTRRTGGQLDIGPQAFGVVFSTALAGLGSARLLPVVGLVADWVGRRRAPRRRDLPVLRALTLMICLAAIRPCSARRFLTGLWAWRRDASFISLLSETSESVPCRDRQPARGGFRRRRDRRVARIVTSFRPMAGDPLHRRWCLPADRPGDDPGHGAPGMVSFLVAAGRPQTKSAARCAGLSRPVDHGDTRFELVRDIAARASVLELRSGPERDWARCCCCGSVLLHVHDPGHELGVGKFDFWFAAVGIAPEQPALALALFNLVRCSAAAAGALLEKYGGLARASLDGCARRPRLCRDWMVGAFARRRHDGGGIVGLLLGCGSSGLIALSAITYPIAIRSTGIGWATGIGRLGSVAGPLAVGQMAGAQWEVPTIFLAAGGWCSSAPPRASDGHAAAADTKDAPVAVAPASWNA